VQPEQTFQGELATRHTLGEPWTIESLKEHARKIENDEINTKDIHTVCGVRGKPIFDDIPLRRFITPILHHNMTIGVVEDIVAYVAELQAAAEGYSDEYYTKLKPQLHNCMRKRSSPDLKTW
jgi:hypothetical protein